MSTAYLLLTLFWLTICLVAMAAARGLYLPAITPMAHLFRHLARRLSR